MISNNKIRNLFLKLCLKHSGQSKIKKLFGLFAEWQSPPFYGLKKLAMMNPKGFISPYADISHSNLVLGHHVLIDDRVTIFQSKDGGPILIGNHVHIYRDTVIQNGQKGRIKFATGLVIQPRCHFSAYKGSIEIGENAQIAANCAFYSYNHGFAADKLIVEQPMKSKGDIIIEDDAWLGFGVIVLNGVKVGKGAVIGAGSVVTKSIPDGAIASGNPARVIRMRS